MLMIPNLGQIFFEKLLFSTTIFMNVLLAYTNYKVDALSDPSFSDLYLLNPRVRPNHRLLPPKLLVEMKLCNSTDVIRDS